MEPIGFKAAPQQPIIYGDGEHDDTDALEALANGIPVAHVKHGTISSLQMLPSGRYLTKRTIEVKSPQMKGILTFSDFGVDWSGKRNSYEEVMACLVVAREQHLFIKIGGNYLRVFDDEKA